MSRLHRIASCCAAIGTALLGWPTAGISAGEKASFFPLAAGTSWTYQNSSGQKTTLRIKAQIQRGDLNYWLAETDGPGEVLYLQLSDALVRVENPDVQNRQLWVLLRQPASKGLSWPAHRSGDLGGSKERPAYFKVAGEEDVTIGERTYAGCQRIDFYPAGSPYPAASSWYAPEVGPVRILEQETDWQLSEHLPGAETAPANRLTLARWFEQLAQRQEILPRTALKPTAAVAEPHPPRPVPGVVFYLVPLFLFFFMTAALILLRRYLIQESLALGFVAKGNLQMALRKIEDGAAEEALASLRQNFPEGHRYPDVLYTEGLALENLQLTEEALEKFSQALALNPNYQKPLISRAYCLKKLGRFEEAENDFRQLLAQKLHYPDLHNALGELLVIRGQREQALWHFQEALRLNPQYRTARENLEKLGN